MQKGLSSIFIIVGILVLVGVAGGAYFLGRSNKSEFTKVVSQPQSTALPTLIPQASDSGETKNWKTYTSSDNFFAIKYPVAWYQYNLGGVVKDGSYGVAFSTKPDSENGWRDLRKDDFAFSIQVSPNKETTYSSGWDIIKAFPPEKRYIGAEYQTTKEISKIISLPTIDGIQGFEIESVSPPGFQGEGYYFRRTYIANDNKIIVITPFSTLGKVWYQTKIELFNQILSTFKFTQ